MNIAELKALYEANKVNGRGEYCPRTGVYTITDVYKGTCYGKQALMAKARWKPTMTDGYNEDFTVVMQLESFKGLHTTDKENWQGREIVVTSAAYQKETKQFTLEWEVVQIKTISLADLNSLLASCDDALANSLLESTDDVELSDDLIDYGIDDSIEY